MHIPSSQDAPLIRTDFSDQTAWEKLVASASNPADPFKFFMAVIDDRANSGATLEQLLLALPSDFPNSFIVVADSVAMLQSGHPLLVVDLSDQRGAHFRAAAAEIASIDSNLSIANMDFDEFADAVEDDGVFRGFPEG